MAESLREYRRRYYAANREKVKAQSRAWREGHPEQARAINKAYASRNAEQRREYQKKYRAVNRGALSEQSKEKRRAAPGVAMVRHAQYAARIKNVPFALLVSDIVIPKVCPVLGTTLAVGHGSRTDASPSLDRIVPSLGYVKGNVRVISWRANNIKSDASARELRAVLRYVEEANGGD